MKRLLAACLVTLACGTQPPSLSAADSRGSHGDLDAVRASLYAADAAHAAATAALGPVDGYASFLAADAYFLAPRVHVIQGRRAATAWLAANTPAGAALALDLVHGDVSGDGSRGYTFGYRRMTAPVAGGTQVLYGKYASFWRRHGDRWTVIAHVFNSGALEFEFAGPPSPGFFSDNDGSLAREDAGESAGLDALRAADVAFSDLSVAQGTGVAFGTYAAPDAVTLPGGIPILYGKEVIGEAYAPAPGDPSASWIPHHAGIASSGDLGFTIGYATFTWPDPAEPPFFSKYLTIWALQPDGTWRFQVDGGNATPPPPPAP